jgi:hypothetical protein
MDRYATFATMLTLTGSVGASLAVACSSDDSSSSSSSGGTRDNGAACTASSECKSNLCKTQGTAGGDAGLSGTFCTIACTMIGQTDPTCSGDHFTGKCTGQNFCQLK